jgi:fumarate hydratase subunit beta
MSVPESPLAGVTVPLDAETICQLRVGSRILLSGTVYTARDADHKRMVESLIAGQSLPIPLSGQVIYYVGPSPARPGEIIGAAGPTTSTRMDPYTPILLQHGLKGMIGKGSRSAEVKASLVRCQAVYFVAVGGAAALIAARIKHVELVAYEDLGTEAIYKLVVEDFPLLVANDTYGMDLYEQGKAAYRR